MRILVAGESWTTHSVHIKGFDSFETSSYAEGGTEMIAALRAGRLELGADLVSRARALEPTLLIDEGVEAGVAFVNGAGPADALVVLSHDAAIDVPLLDAALWSSIGYVGGMGSRGTQTRRRNALIEAGHSEQELLRIHGPIGLDLGSRTPAETAVAIVAEYLANRSGRAPGRLTDADGPING